jgi:stage IV sporulation protein FB
VLLMLAILVFFSARHEGRLATSAVMDEALANAPRALNDMGEDEDEDVAGKDFEGRGEDTRVTSSGSFAHWREKRRLQRIERQRAQEADEERRVDEILLRLHAEGMESLSTDDRAILNRVSARYRDRQRNPS